MKTNIKKILFLLGTVFIVPSGYARENPMFADGTENSITAYIAQGTGGHDIRKLISPLDWDFSPQTFLMLSYAQPRTIMRIPARTSINIMQNIAYESSNGLSFVGFGVSWDISIIDWHGFYLGAGIGPYYRDNHDRWVSSRLFFGERIFIGKNIGEHIRGEIFTIHFSNGDLTDVNCGFNFAGIGINYSF